MKIIKVQYTVAEAFADTNKQNISAVMAELREQHNPNVKYASFQHDDLPASARGQAGGKTFTHLVLYNTSDSESLPAGLASFKEFQKQLKENIEVPPKAETLELVDSSYELF